MKLKKLLKLIPDEYKIGLTDYEGNVTLVSYGTKEDAVMNFAQKTALTKEMVEDMRVATVSPCARVYCVRLLIGEMEVTLCLIGKVMSLN